MKLEENGKASSGKRARHFSIKCFCIAVLIERKAPFRIQCCSTGNMTGDCMTKLLTVLHSTVWVGERLSRLPFCFCDSFSTFDVWLHSVLTVNGAVSFSMTSSLLQHGSLSSELLTLIITTGYKNVSLEREGAVHLFCLVHCLRRVGTHHA